MTNTHTVQQVAHLLQITPATVRALIQRGDLHAIKAGRHWQIPSTALTTFMQGDNR